MSNQIVISSGAKVRSLEGVLTGTAGIVSSVPYGGANGVATLDSSGKVPLSQLPSSVITYLGTWNASTNTPTLTNGVGDDGDLYICNVAGTVNFGAGPITFAVGDWVIYGSGTWQKSAGASGTVTSVALSESGDALTITGSPITTSGTINIGFAGTNLQYINGEGNLTTFPSLTGYVPYTGATANVDLGTFDLTADVITGATGSFASSGSSDTFAINHSSGSGISLNITKGGNGEGLYINKTSGSGNAATIIGTLNATTLVKNGGTSSQYLMADGSVSTGPDLTGYVPYTGATTNVDLGSRDLLTRRLYLNTNNQGIYARDSAGTNLYQIFALNSSDKVSIDQTGLGTVFGGNVDLGSYDLTGNYINGKQLTVNKNGTTGGALFIESGSAGFGFGGTSGIAIASGSTNNLTLAFTDATATNTKAAILNFGSLTNNTNRTYTLPDISGTLALTSNLSAYVPYTGATTNVDLGINSLATTGSISANNGTFIGAGSLAGQVILKWGSGFNSIASYSGIGGISGGFYLNTNIAGATKVALFDLSGLTNSTQRTFTFPDASGTIALTSQLTNGTVTSVTVGTGEAGTNVSANVATSTTTPVITINIPIASATNTGKLSNTDWTTFNNKLNLTGGTLTGGLYINPTNTGVTGLDVASNNTSFRSDNLEGSKRQLLMTMGSGTLISLTGKGYEAARVTDIAFYTSTSGGVNASPSIYMTGSGNVGIGTGTTSGKLDVRASGTSAFTYYFRNSAGNYGGGIYNTGGNNTQLYLATSAGTENVVLSASGASYLLGGNVGIGTSSPSRLLTVVSASDGITAGISGATYGIRFDNGGAFSSGMSTIHGVDASLTGSYQPIMINGSDVRFGTSAGERGRFTTAGYFKARGTESGYYNLSGNHHELRTGQGGEWNTVMTSTASDPYGLLIGLTPGLSNTVNEFIAAYVGNFSTLRFKVASNGGIYNFSGNNVNLSDISTKKDIIACESYWDKFKAIEIVKFKYIDQSHDDYNIGVIAQQVEEVAPEFIDTDNWNKQDEEPRILKAVYTEDLHHATIKVLQEAMAKIEELTAKVSALENKS